MTMLFRRKPTREDHIKSFYWWLFDTQERFDARLSRQQVATNAAREAGTHLKSKRGYMNAQEAWEAMLVIAALRADLMKQGWLPPRESDVLARSGNERGTLFAGEPIKWKIERQYQPTDFPIGVSRYFYDDEQ